MLVLSRLGSYIYNPPPPSVPCPIKTREVNMDTIQIVLIKHKLDYVFLFLYWDSFLIYLELLPYAQGLFPYKTWHMMAPCDLVTHVQGIPYLGY